MHDFLGNEFKIGNYVVAGGAGNTKAEYGMILYKVISVQPTIRLKRLDVRYCDDDLTVCIHSTKVTIQNPNKYLQIEPSEKMKDLFERALVDRLSCDEREAIANWIHGAQHQKCPV